MNIYKDILNAIEKSQRLLAVLIDPDKFQIQDVSEFILKLNNSMATHIFVGGSTVGDSATEKLVIAIKIHSNLPIVLFPGDITQITGHADALLFLSLISGRNAEYLIGKHIESVPLLNETNLEVLPTGYILIENGKETAVERVTKTKPMARANVQQIVNTALAGELLGMKLMYLEAGSGAMDAVPLEIISKVKKELNIPIIVGGGIRTRQQLDDSYNSGADLVVIGTAFENDESFFDQLHMSLL
jgi:putative glycerol-1-phosphate prenyltransferase